MNLYNMSKRITRKLFIAVAFFALYNVWGQDPYQYNPSEKMFLPTPEQASLLKFTDIPPGNHTGVQGYSIPIYTIQGKEFSLPISINYHGMGIKVNEVSGSVGIGWALSIGGISLSQEVRGERDQEMERFSAYFNPGNFTPETLPDENDAYRDGLAMLAMSPGTHAYTPVKEFHPDYFSYSLLNNQGKFMLDNDNIAHTIPKDNIKIVGDNSFILTDSKGLIYHFSSYLQEKSQYGNGINSYGGIVENRENYGYKLDYIEIPHSNETITFNYYKVEYAYASSHTVTKKVSVSAINGGISTILAGSNTFGLVTEYLPKSIEYNRVKVEFKYKMNGSKFLGRNDVDLTQSFELIGNRGGILEYIEVSDNANNTKIKNYQLATDYFTSSGSTADMSGPLGTTQAPLFKRLKFEGIHELLSDTRYDFEYFGETEEIVLPPRFSYNVDYWGMYNGKNNNTELHSYVIPAGGKKRYFPGADKTPDLTFARIGSLKKVFLPTGGYQEFDYELDEFKNTVFDDDDTEFHAVHNYEEREHELFNESFPYASTTYNNYIVNITPPAPDYREGFSHVFTFYTNDQPETVDSPDDLPEESHFYVQLYENGQLLPRKYFMNGDYELPQLDPENEYYFKITRFYVSNEANFITHPSQMQIYMSLKWVQDNVTNPPNRNAGTLRVKSITLNDANGNAQIKRSYAYKEFGNPGFSSGKFTGRQISEYYTTKEPNSSGGGNNDVFNITNNDMYNLTQSFGKSVLYENVTETYESTDPLQTSDNHKKEYIFSESATPGFTALTAPIVPEPHDYLGGMLLEERVFNSESEIVRITKNEYYNPDTFFNQFSGNHYSVPSALSAALVISMGGSSFDHPFEIRWYNITSAWIKLKKTTVEEFENNVLTMSNYTEYAYNENTGDENEFKSILPVSKITGTSLKNGTYEEKLKTVYKYPQDLVGIEQAPYMQNLKDANRISDPVVTETYLVKSGVETKLSELHMKYGSNLLPSEVHFRQQAGAINLTSIEDRKVRYSQYDANGNILEYILEDGTPVSVVWGYNDQFPIAKVEGIAYSTVDDYISFMVTDSNEDIDNCIGLTGCNEAELRVSQNTFRKQTNLSTALITTYTYDPLLGVTSITQPNGVVEYYKYDTAGRLDMIFDKNKNVLKKMEYNYKD